MNLKLVQLLERVKSLPYARNSDRSNYLLVPQENRGTCSTKHAYVKHLAIQNGWQEVRLFIGIYMMNDKNTPGVGSTLKKYGLLEIPEAHTYLKVGGEITDVTGIPSGAEEFQKSLKKEEEITPEQIGEYKLNFHKTYIQEWAEETNYSSSEVWEIREKCIKALVNLY